MLKTKPRARMSTRSSDLQTWGERKRSSFKRMLYFSGLFALQNLSNSAEPHIDLIERLGTNQITIHFGTDANRTYELQFLVSVTCPTNAAGTTSAGCNSNGVPAGSWSNLFVAPSIPFPNHYVVVDTIRNLHQFYRLRVTP